MVERAKSQGDGSITTKVKVRERYLRLLVALLLPWLGLTTFSLWDSYRSTHDLITRQLRHMSQMLASRVEVPFTAGAQAVDQIATTLSEGPDPIPVRQRLEPVHQARIDAWLAGERKLLPGISALRVFDAQGSKLFSSRHDEPDFSIADRPFFLAIQARPEHTPLFTDVLKGRLTGRDSIFLVQALKQPHSQTFAGVSLAVVDLGVFKEEINRLALPDAVEIEIHRLDSGVRVLKFKNHLQPQSSADGSEISTTLLAAIRAAEDPRQADLGVASPHLEIIDQHIGYSRVNGTPFVVSTQIDSKDLYATWLRRSVGSLSLSALSLILLLWTIRRLILLERERGKEHDRLQRSEARLRQLFDNNSSIILQVAPATGRILEANLAACRFYGWTHDELCRMSVQEINQLSPDEVAAARTQAAREQRNVFIFPHRLANGEIRQVEVHSTPIEFDDQTVLVSILHDITDRILQETRLHELLDEQRSILEGDLVGMLKVHNRHIVWANAAFGRMFRIDPQTLIGQSTRRFFADDASFEAYGAEAYPFVTAGQFHRSVHQFHLGDGSTGWFDLNIGPVDPDRRIAIASFVDITARVEAEQRARELADHDALTGLPNRRLLTDRLEQGLKMAHRRQHQLALMFIDIDHFKDINDSRGHAFGDDVLIAMAERLRSGVRNVDTVARMGGDEFIVMLPEIGGEADAAFVARKLLERLVQEPLRVRGLPLTVTLSIGIAIFDPRSAESAEQLMVRADQAMYAVKHSTRNAWKLAADPTHSI